MDEILASIRKIISEEPSGRPARQPGDASAEWMDLGSSGNQPTRTDDRQSAQGSSGKKESLDDILDMAGAMPQPERPVGDNTLSAQGEVPSWLFPGQQGDDRLQKGPEPDRRDAARGDAPRPFFNGKPASEQLDSSTSTGHTAAPLSSPSRSEAGDLGAVVPQRNGGDAGGLGSMARTGLGARKPQQVRLPERAKQAATAAGLTGPVAPPAEPTRALPRENDTNGSALSELAAAARGIANGQAERTADAAIKPDGSKIAVTPDGRDAADAVVQSGLTKDDSTEQARAGSETGRSLEAVGNELQIPSYQEDLSGRKEAAPIEAPANGIHRDGAGGAEKPSAALPVSETLPAVQKPSVLERSRPKAAAGEPDLANVSQAGGVRTLEDTVVDLLRPMIRQWLDDNMPRMLEKALRVELASSVKDKIERAKH